MSSEPSFEYDFIFKEISSECIFDLCLKWFNKFEYKIESKKRPNNIQASFTQRRLQLSKRVNLNVESFENGSKMKIKVEPYVPDYRLPNANYYETVIKLVRFLAYELDLNEMELLEKVPLKEYYDLLNLENLWFLKIGGIIGICFTFVMYMVGAPLYMTLFFIVITFALLFLSKRLSNLLF